MAKRNYPQNRKSTPRAGTGAGRPVEIEDRRTISIGLPAIQLLWLDTQGNRSEVIRNLIQKAMEEK